MLELYHFEPVSNSAKCLIYLHEKGVEFTSRQLIKFRNPVHDELRDVRQLARQGDPGDSDAFRALLERIERIDLAFVYDPLETTPEVSPLPAARAGRVTFGSMNALSKISAPVIQLWGRILTALPDARLLLVAVPDGRTRERITGLFAAQGVASTRLEMHAAMSKAKRDARLDAKRKERS